MTNIRNSNWTHNRDPIAGWPKLASYGVSFISTCTFEKQNPVITQFHYISLCQVAHPYYTPCTTKLLGWDIGFTLSVRPAVHLSRIMSVLARCLFRGVYVPQIQPMRVWCVAYHFQVNSSKVKVTHVIWIFSCVCSMCGMKLLIHTQTPMVQPLKFEFNATLYWACDYLSMLRLKLMHVIKRAIIWWICSICGTNTTHEWTMCRIPFPGQ